MNISNEILANPILRNVQEKFELQTAKGLAKYGETVNPDSYSVEGWLNHLQEELIDGAVYVETVLSKLNDMQLIQENVRLRNALKFYADVNNHPTEFSEVEKDGGYKARQALEGENNDK
ncbi:hypothetical protein [Viridibacillus arvi]|uniref:hypothetical protein n=1 Tax=Viridibacillus arvi TaxID=263475 RepID=UPI003CFD7A3F